MKSLPGPWDKDPQTVRTLRRVRSLGGAQGGRWPWANKPTHATPYAHARAQTGQ